MKRIILFFTGLLVAASSASAAAFFTKSTQGASTVWASIWTNATQTTAVAPTAGNTYEAVANAIPFGANVNNTRVRNPYGAGAVGGVQTFPGDSLTLSANAEFRFKNDNITLTSVNFPGVGGNPGLILNGGVLNAGNDFVFPIDGNIFVAATSFICPADVGAGAILQARGFNILGSLSGSSDLFILQAGTTVAQQVSHANNSYNGQWIVKAGWLRGNAVGSLGTGNIIVDPLFTVPITTASTLSNGPAQVELMYDIGTTGTLTLMNGGKMILHQHCVFGAVTIEGTPLSVGKHTYPELVAAYPNNFPAGGSGSITVGRVVTVNTVNNETPGAGETSLNQALAGAQEGDVIRFNIAGAGPHVIVTPIGGYPLITANSVTIDGYSQPGSSPNTNPILSGNNAQIKIVLDSTGTDSAPNPDPNLPNRPLVRSTRLDFPALVGNTGYGESENCIIGVYQGDNAAIRGLSFIARHTAGSELDPSIYAVALIDQATNAHVNGCLFGMAPGGSTMADVKPAASAVAAFRWRIGGDVYSDGLRFGTDGDGANDRAEFNVALGCRIALALELPEARVSGNYINVFPNGLTFVDVDAIYDQLVTLGGGESVEVFENGRFAHNTIIGTDGNGISDSDERNVWAHPVYDHDIEFYSAGTNVVVAGNYVGVGIDGVTPGPVTTNGAVDFISLPGTASVRVGSNGDGVSDDLEGNLIVNGNGSRFVAAGAGIPAINRRNKLVNNLYSTLSNDPSLVPAVLNAITNNVLSGTMPTPPAIYSAAAFVDVYTVDPAALANNAYWPVPIVHPFRYLGTFTDNGPGDVDPAVDHFSFDLASYGLSDNTYVTVFVTHSQDGAASNAGAAVTGPAAWPVSRRPELEIRLDGPNVELSWLAPENAFAPQQNASLNPGDWAFIFGSTPTYGSGRNILSMPFDAFASLLAFRLISQ
jgi:hypothetical protein